MILRPTLIAKTHHNRTIKSTYIRICNSPHHQSYLNPHSDGFPGIWPM